MLDVAKILSELNKQREELEGAIAALEGARARLSPGKRGKPKPPGSGGGQPPTPEIPPGSGGAAQVACTFGTTRSRRETPREPS
jgi:hypothetical protein